MSDTSMRIAEETHREAKREMYVKYLLEKDE